jgi:hypothetical protein
MSLGRRLRNYTLEVATQVLEYWNKCIAVTASKHSHSPCLIHQTSNMDKTKLKLAAFFDQDDEEPSVALSSIFTNQTLINSRQNP